MAKEQEPQSAREAIAEALYKLAVDSARKEIEGREPAIEDAREFFVKLRNETDAGLAVLLTSYIDTHFSDAMKKNMPGLTKSSSRFIFENAGPLSTFSARLRVAHALGWLSEKTFSDLHLIRKIRNIFAHDPYKSSFSDKSVEQLVDSMSPIERPIFDLVRLTDEFRALSARELFHIRSCLIFHGAIVDLLALPAASRHQVHPVSVVGAYPEGPSFFVKHRRASADSVCDLLHHFVGIEFADGAQPRAV